MTKRSRRYWLEAFWSNPVWAAVVLLLLSDSVYIHFQLYQVPYTLGVAVSSITTTLLDALCLIYLRWWFFLPHKPKRSTKR